MIFLKKIIQKKFNTLLIAHFNNFFLNIHSKIYFLFINI